LRRGIDYTGLTLPNDSTGIEVVRHTEAALTQRMGAVPVGARQVTLVTEVAARTSDDVEALDSAAKAGTILQFRFRNLWG
jgi:hypothetical protein